MVKTNQRMLKIFYTVEIININCIDKLKEYH